MRLRSGRRAALPLALGLALALASTTAVAAPRPDLAASCMQSADRAQVLRRQGKLTAAGAALAECAAATCPAVVRDDCRTWTAEVQAAQPTLVFSVRDTGGRDLADARVVVDGTVFVEHADGLARPLDPGPHLVEVQAGEAAPVRLRIVVQEGEKQRVVPIVIRRDIPDEAAPSTSITPWVYVAGTVAVLGLTGFTYFGLTAISDHAALRDGCATTGSCTDDQIQSSKARFWMADVSLLIGLVGGGITGYLFYAR